MSIMVADQVVSDISEVKKYRDKCERLEKELHHLRQAGKNLEESPYTRRSLERTHLKWVIRKDVVLNNEFGHRINEVHGTMFEIKNTVYRYAQLLGIEADMVRTAVGEGLQNALEHGYGEYAEIEILVNNFGSNENLQCTFKHQMPAGQSYTLSDIDQNANRGDITSESFDFEDARGRGEFLMQQIANERKIVNGIEIAQDGRKIHYFKRILVFYRDPQGPKEKISFAELKQEIDRLNYEDVVCCFHVDHKINKCHNVSVACHKSQQEKLDLLMKENGFEPVDFEIYYRAIFATYRPLKPAEPGLLYDVFKKVRRVMYQES